MPSVLHVVTGTQRRGAETAAVDLCGALAAAGIPGTVVALGASEGGGLDVPVLGAGGTRSPATLRALRAHARRHDVVVAHGADTLLASAVGLLGARRPFVYRLIGDPRHWSGRGLRRARVRWALGRAAAVVALDPAAVPVLTGGYGVGPERVRVIPNAVDLARFALRGPEGRRRARAELGLDADAPVVAVVGALSEEKRPLAAVAAGLAADPAAVVLVAGDGPLRDRLPADPRVRALGSLDDVRPVYGAADVVVLASATEGVPAAAIEAAASGVPVVATDVGGTGTVVGPAVGLLVPPLDDDALASALRRVLAGAHPHDPLAARAEVAARCSLDAAAVAWASLLRPLLGSGGGPAGPRSGEG